MKKSSDVLVAQLLLDKLHRRNGEEEIQQQPGEIQEERTQTISAGEHRRSCRMMRAELAALEDQIRILGKYTALQR